MASSLEPDVLSGVTVRPARLLLDPDLLEQFDRSVESPADDGRHALAGWLVRFDPRQVVLADPAARVQGTLRYEETSPDTLDVIADHTYTYAVRPAAQGPGPAGEASLFTVHREVHFRFDREDLRMHRAELVISTVEAGPQACGADNTGSLKPLLAGARAPGAGEGPAVTDPYATGRPAARALRSPGAERSALALTGPGAGLRAGLAVSGRPARVRLPRALAAAAAEGAAELPAQVARQVPGAPCYVADQLHQRILAGPHGVGVVPRRLAE